MAKIKVTTNQIDPNNGNFMSAIFDAEDVEETPASMFVVLRKKAKWVASIHKNSVLTLEEVE